VPVTTLDKLINKYGNPVYCKIDVEGFEFHVLRGLSQPIKNISFEFTPEYIEVALDSIKHLITLGSVQFNFTIEMDASFGSSEWVGSDEISKILSSLPNKNAVGEVYARFIE